MDAMLTYQSPRTAASSDEGSDDGGDCDNEWGIAARGPEWENYTIVRCLGRGSQGSAYLCRQKRRTPLCAAEDGSVVIKAVYCGGMDEKELARAMMEVSILGGLAHENVVKYYDYFMDEAGMLCTAMEYAGGGDLGGLIRDNKRAGVATPSEAVFDAGRQLLRALRYLRGRRVLHRDVKPENILVAAGGLLQLGDFGVARILEVDQPGAATFTGTPYYISPELCLGEPYDFAADVWSLGVTLYELATHAHPFTGNNLLAIVNSITDGAYAPIPKGLHTPAVVTLITTLLTPDPTERPTAAETLRWYFPASETDGRTGEEEEEDMMEEAAAGETAAASRDDGARPSSPATSVASSAPDLRWLDGRARGSAADGELERKIRAKAEALQRKRLLLHRKRKAAVVAAVDVRPVAATAAAAADEAPPCSSAAALVKARFLTCVYERKANEGRRTRNADGYKEARKMMGHILSDEEEAVSGQSSSDDDDDDDDDGVDGLHQATRELFASKASRQCLRSIKKVMNETVRRRAELGIEDDDDDDDDSSTTSSSTASNTTELEAEEEEGELGTESEGEEGERTVDPDCVQMVLRLGDGGGGGGGAGSPTPEKAGGFRVRNVAEGEEHTRLLAGAEELLGLEGGGGGGSVAGQKGYALYWVDGDGDRVRILTEEDTRHAVEAYWVGVEMTMEVQVVAA